MDTKSSIPNTHNVFHDKTAYMKLIQRCWIEDKIYAQNNERKFLHLSMSNTFINASIPNVTMMNKCKHIVIFSYGYMLQNTLA